jgi:hypothetical protein
MGLDTYIYKASGPGIGIGEKRQSGEWHSRLKYEKERP